MVNFPNKFEGDRDDKELAKKLTTPEELSGFFNWAIEGLKRLLAQGQFSTGKTMEETREYYIRMSDPARAFIAARIRQREIGQEPPTQEAYQRFLEYCAKYKLPSIAVNVFTMKMAQHAPYAKITQKRIGPDRVRVWEGIELLANEEEDLGEDADDGIEPYVF